MAIIEDGEIEFNLVQLPSYQEFTNWQNRYHPILPFCYFTLKASRTAVRWRKLVQKGFKIRPETLGQHLRSRRLVLKLTQAQVAERLNTLREHYERWERDEATPIASVWPKLVRHFGHYPLPVTSPADWVLKARRVNGLSQFALGRAIMVIAKTVRQWEHGQAEPPDTMLEKIKDLAMGHASSCD